MSVYSTPSVMLSNKQKAFGLAFLILTWSVNWSVNKVGLQYAPPLVYAALRTLVGGLLFTLFLLPQWRAIEWKKNWSVYLIVALFNTIILIGGQQLGLQYLPSGLFSVIIYTQPIFVVIYAWLFLRETLTPGKIIGMLIGFAGVAIVSMQSLLGHISLTGVLFALISSNSWAIGIIYVKKTNAQVHALWLVTLQNVIGGFCLLAISGFIEDFSMISWSAPMFACISYSGIVAQSISTYVYFKLMSAGEASKVSSFTFLIPLIAVSVGTFILKEPFTLSLFIGLLFVLCSIYIINRKTT